jgi:hypothetical protein
LAENNVIDYDNKLNLYRKMRAFQMQTQDLSKRLAKLEGLE